MEALAHLELNVKQPGELDRDLLDGRLLAVDVYELGRVVVGQSVVQVLGRTGLPHIEEDVVEDDLLVVVGRCLEVALKVECLSSLAVEQLLDEVCSTLGSALELERIHRGFDLKETVVETLRDVMLLACGSRRDGSKQVVSIGRVENGQVIVAALTKHHRTISGRLGDWSGRKGWLCGSIGGQSDRTDR